MNVTESSVRVGFVDGENESVSPVIDTASVIVTFTADNLCVTFDGSGLVVVAARASSAGTEAEW